MDTRLALDELGIDEKKQKLGISFFQITIPWPLEPESVREFSNGLDKIIVFEEKRGVIEPQLKEILYHTANAPLIIGKQDEEGSFLFPSVGALETNHVALSLSKLILKKNLDESVREKAKRISERIPSVNKIQQSLIRSPLGGEEANWV